MAQKSILWTTGATGDGATTYVQAEVIRWQRQFLIGADNEGVAKDYLNEMVTTGTSSPVATNTGAASVHGFPYWNTTSVDTAIPTPSGNTRIDRLVLRANWSAQTIRITRIAGTEGTGNPPSIVQTDGTTWDVPLCQASITTGGVITLTDEREFLHPNIGVNTAMLDDDAVTLANMAAESVDSPQYVDGSIDRVHLAADIIDGTKIEDSAIDTEHLAADSIDDTKAGNRVPQFYRRQGGSATVWSTHGTTTYTPTAVRMQGGVRQVTFAGITFMDVTVTFPTAFSYAPQIQLSHLYTGPHVFVIAIKAVSATTVEIRVSTADGSTATALSVYVYWLAIGSE